MIEVTITNAVYVKDTNDTIQCINAEIDGVLVSIPMDEGNRHYDEIMRQVEAGTLTIADAEE